MVTKWMVLARIKKQNGLGIWDGEVGLGWGTGNGGKMGKVKFPIF